MGSNQNSGTATATFRLWRFYTAEFVADAVALSTYSDIAAESAAATTIYAAERIVTFRGPHRIRGVHIESAVTNTMLEMLNNLEMQGVDHALIENCLFKSAARYSAGGASDAAYRVQQGFPFIIQEIGKLTLRDNTRGEHGPVILDTGHGETLTVSNPGLIINPRVCGGSSYTPQVELAVWVRAPGARGFITGLCLYLRVASPPLSIQG